ncbi:DUF2213 domain-containing protein [Providencia rettgeri]|uniref:DUF2213 domain-containing protein n=1 Tax=Providencia lanzhouensis TaxID=3378099 RepID=UPI0034D0F20A
MKMTDSLAFDSGTSMRSKDANGHLTVERTVISKAAVNPYYGREIPDSERLGLEPERIYYMLRDPVELERAANTFSKKQLLIKHIPVDSDEPQKQSTIGTIGSNITFEDGRLFADLCVWDGYAIGLIEAEKMKELSAGYGYTADMTSGEFEGQYYDGVMRNIIGNHVALVERGRIGRDAIISDHQTVDLEKLMKLKKGALANIAAQTKTALGMDSDLTEAQLHAIVNAVALGMDEVSTEALVGAKDEEAKKAEDEKEEDKKASDEDDAKKKAEDEQTQAERDNESEAMRIKEREERERKDREKDKAMDSAIKLAEDQAVARVTKLFEAREEVKSLVGQVAMDSADDVYAYALKQCGVDISGVHPSAFKTMVGMVKQNRAQPQKASLGMDSAAFAEDPYTTRFKQA